MKDRAQQRFVELFGPEFGHGKPFDLGQLRSVLHALGNPHLKLPPVIHVAGTNGKGSTIAFMRAICEAAGLSVHAFTKPHLFCLNERFVVAGEPASDDALSEAAERIQGAEPALTQFDAQVAAAFLLFHETPADVVLLETGMGGRDDSTNVLPAPVLTAITPIGLDHQDVLGKRLSEIAAHKAGILKPRVPAIVGRQSDIVREIIEAQAEHLNAPLYRHGVEWDAYEHAGRLVVQTDVRALDLPLPALPGRHQIDNAGLACATLLAPWAHAIHDDAFADGVATARWPGRLQALTRNALGEPVRAVGGEVWVDGGHNAHAAQALADALRAMARKRPAPNVLIVGLRARKDAAAFVSAFSGVADHVIAIPLGEAHASPEELVSHARASGIEAGTAATLHAAIQNAAQFPAPRVLICGSFLLAAEALSAA